MEEVVPGLVLNVWWELASGENAEGYKSVREPAFRKRWVKGINSS